MSHWHPDYSEQTGLATTEQVFEGKEPKASKLLDQWGNRIPYQSRKLGYIGFYPLKLTKDRTS